VVRPYNQGGFGPVGELPACRKAWPFGPLGNNVFFGGAPHGSRAWDREEAVLFLHRRTMPSGQDRIVLVVVQGMRMGPGRRVLWFRYTIVAPGSWTRDPTIRGGFAWGFPPQWQQFPKAIQLYPGQPDPGDPTHFTVGYEYDGRPGTIDAYLQDKGSANGERIRFVVRDGPVKTSGDPPAEGSTE